MNESQWDDKLRAFLKKTGEDLKRAGGDIKVEAERLMKEVKDPERQEKVKKGLTSFREWAKKTAEEVAQVVEVGVKKADAAVRGAVDNAPGAASSSAPPATSPTPTPEEPAHTEPMRHDTPIDTPAVDAAPPSAPTKKTIGGAKKKSAGKAKAGAKKPLGKKRTP